MQKSAYSLSPFSTFDNLNDKELDYLEAKITYIGEQRKLLPSIVIIGPKVDRFQQNIITSRIAGFDFKNDDISRELIVATREQLATMIDNISGIPSILNAGYYNGYNGGQDINYGIGTVTSDALLAFTMLCTTTNEERHYKVVLTQHDSKLLLDAIGRAFATDEKSRQGLLILWRALGFHIGFLDPDSDQDGASDGRELSHGTDPLNPDSDGDGKLDGAEILEGIDPLNPLHAPPLPELLKVEEGSFKGSRVVEAITSPDIESKSGTVMVEIMFTPHQAVSNCKRVLFIQTFKRMAVKANGYKIPILPSLYLVYAGSPELDHITIEGQTVDHKVGELDPYYNGDDLQDKFSGVPDKQKPGSYIKGDEPQASRMLYRCRTHEDHWRALNPEGIKEVEFEYETAAFCESGDGVGQFLGVTKWHWGKKRGGPIDCSIRSASAVESGPKYLVDIITSDQRESVPVYSFHDPGQPTRRYFEVLSLWLKYHKFMLPGPKVSLKNSVELVIPQPVLTNIEIHIEIPSAIPTDTSLRRQGLSLGHYVREITAQLRDGGQLPDECFPFGTPLVIKFAFNDSDITGLNEKKLGIGRFDLRTNTWTSEGVNVLKKDLESRTITFSTTKFGLFGIVGGVR
jgi:hypothetical protein